MLLNAVFILSAMKCNSSDELFYFARKTVMYLDNNNWKFIFTRASYSYLLELLIQVLVHCPI